MKSYSLQEASSYLATHKQLYYARRTLLDDGPGRGLRLVEVSNGSGLSFTVVPDRGMNLVECSFAGVPVPFLTPGGHRNVTGDWLRDWAGGLMTSCGLRNVGVPSGGESLHGKLSSLAAENLCVSEEAGQIVISGILREGVIFGENLVLKRRISTAFGANVIAIDDCVCNCGALPEYVEILYHCNFGYPLVSPELKFVVPEHRIEPRDDEAARGLARWDKMESPVAGFQEQCFRHFLPAREDHWAAMRIENAAIGMAVEVRYDTRTLPLLVEWKNCAANNYVLGLEPANGTLNGRMADVDAQAIPLLEPGQTIKFHMALAFEQLV